LSFLSILSLEFLFSCLSRDALILVLVRNTQNGHHETQHNDTHHNDIHHKGLISDIEHNDTQHNETAIMLNVIVLSVAIFFIGMLNVVMLKCAVLLLPVDYKSKWQKASIFIIIFVVSFSGFLPCVWVAPSSLWKSSFQLHLR